MRQVVLGSLIAILVALVTAAPTPALAHDGVSPSAQGAAADDRGIQAEAGRLTDDLKMAASRASKGPSIQASVVGAAERRRALINQLAATNPAAVLDLALSPAERAALPASVQPLVEQRVDLDGELEVLHVDHEDGHRSVQASLVNGGRATPLAFGASLGTVKPGDRVRTSGVALSGAGTVVTDQLVTIEIQVPEGDADLARRLEGWRDPRDLRARFGL